MHHVLLVGRLLTLVIAAAGGDTVGAVGALRAIWRRLYHRWQLQLLVVLLVALLSRVALVPLARAEYLLVQLHGLVHRMRRGPGRRRAAAVILVRRRRDLVSRDAAQLVIAV